ncbi:ABC-F family ATP-binding cassette domain-containing protein [Salinactinospora qingdaonensis]|uniref:ABC-F family ATP-binding cassette domain-containing protein n=1 Tax=Salinactinospora qingdaonensis TaxID=702744 RepID=A0ABP7G2F0_9ACTN
MIDHVSKSYGALLALDQVSFTVTPGQRVGVVGRNGAGKTTLLRIIAGWESPDSGEVRRVPGDVTVGYLPQESDGHPDETLADYLSRRSGIAAAEQEVARTAAALSDDAAAAESYQRALDRLTALGAGDFEVRCASVVTSVGLTTAALAAPMATMSGGELARCRLAALLLSRHDFLLLDEPTNDLDFAAQDQLDALTATSPAGIVMVSHDRSFLRRTVTDVVELDHISHRASHYPGDWDAYVDNQHRRREDQYERHERYIAERDRITKMMRRKQQWSREGAARAKSRASDNDKFIRNGNREQAEGLAQGAKALSKRLERLERVEQPAEGWRLRYAIAEAPRSGDIAARLRGLRAQRGDLRVGPVDLDITWGDRIAMLGANGSGKTTLVSLLLGLDQPQAGTVELGAGTVIGSLDQARTVFRSSRPLLEQVERATKLPSQQARALLAKFDLTPQDIARPADSLSPGEHTRAGLALLMAGGVNTLVLDEPTNHLDLAAIDQLHSAIDNFAGTLILVTHNRDLLETTRITRRLHLRTQHYDGRRFTHVEEESG